MNTLSFGLTVNGSLTPITSPFSAVLTNSLLLWISSTLALIITLVIIPTLLTFQDISPSEMPKGVYIKSGNRIL